MVTGSGPSGLVPGAADMVTRGDWCEREMWGGFLHFFSQTGWPRACFPSGPEWGPL